jgi:hypothetical protein
MLSEFAPNNPHEAGMMPISWLARAKNKSLRDSICSGCDNEQEDGACVIGRCDKLDALFEMRNCAYRLMKSAKTNSL